MAWSTMMHGCICVFSCMGDSSMVPPEMSIAASLEVWTMDWPTQPHQLLSTFSHLDFKLGSGKNVGYNNKVAAKGATIIYDDPRWCLYQIHILSTAFRIIMTRTMNWEHMAVLDCHVFFLFSSKACSSYNSMRSGEISNTEWGCQYKGAQSQRS